MNVVDVSVGIKLAMYRITLGNSSLLLTETHPVATSNRGILWAKELKPVIAFERTRLQRDHRRRNRNLSR